MPLVDEEALSASFTAQVPCVSCYCYAYQPCIAAKGDGVDGYYTKHSRYRALVVFCSEGLLVWIPSLTLQPPKP